jgi:predicted nucleotidyltransferase
MDTISQNLRQLLPELRQTYGITRLGIFGSYVRGEQTETSDLDLLVEFDPDRRFGLLTFCAIENLLSDRLNLKVDLVMKDGLKPKIGEQILSEVQYL